jgi:hypothetical protein
LNTLVQAASAPQVVRLLEDMTDCALSGRAGLTDKGGPQSTKLPTPGRPRYTALRRWSPEVETRHALPTVPDAPTQECHLPGAPIFRRRRCVPLGAAPRKGATPPRRAHVAPLRPRAALRSQNATFLFQHKERYQPRAREGGIHAQARGIKPMANRALKNSASNRALTQRSGRSVMSYAAATSPARCNTFPN